MPPALIRKQSIRQRNLYLMWDIVITNIHCMNTIQYRGDLGRNQGNEFLLLIHVNLHALPNLEQFCFLITHGWFSPLHLMHAQIFPHFFLFRPEEFTRNDWSAGVGGHKKYTMWPVDMTRRLSREAYN